MRYYLIAGEASGDLHGSNLVKGLQAEDPGAQFRFWGGDLMAEAAGTPPVRHYREGAVMGFSDVLAKLGTFARNLRFCRQDILRWSPDAVILIDYPGFNLRMARFCHRHRLRTFYYIAPKTWASRAWRNRKLRAWTDRLFIVFPFEIPYFERQGIPFTYRGNPLVDAVDGHRYAPVTEGRYIALLPGSRKSEIRRMMPVCMQAADRLGCNVVIAGAPARRMEDYAPYIGGRKNVQVVFSRTYDILRYADAAIINSGTASLEAALIGTPQVVCWSTSPFTAFIARKILHVLEHVRFISLGNLCLGKEAFRELIQEDFTADAVCAEVRRLCEDENCRKQMQEDYEAIRSRLGGKGASRAVAQAMLAEIKKN
ncbi:MAG: lipid-A-disaccharide synthase [Bacteroidales bacterium]|nr:lipid-A-disaccharide synthase [Bacteroidales bacterium]